MIIGTKSDLDAFVEIFSEIGGQRFKEVLGRVEWVVPEKVWVIREPHDGAFERNVEQRAVRTGTVPRLTFAAGSGNRAKDFMEAASARRASLAKRLGINPAAIDAATEKKLLAANMGTVVVPTVSRPDAQKRGLPPAKKPPSFFGKVASLWRAVKGPRLSPRQRDARLSQCLAKGGYTWSPHAGEVTEISTGTDRITTLTIGGKQVQLPDDERPGVTVGQHVVVGQIVAVGDVAKPCPYMRQSDSTSPTRAFNAHCNACGCGVRKLAELHEKLAFAELVCPRTPPLFTRETPDGDAQ